MLLFYRFYLYRVLFSSATFKIPLLRHNQIIIIIGEKTQNLYLSYCISKSQFRLTKTFVHDEAWYIKIVRVNIYLELYVLVYLIASLYDLAFNKWIGIVI